MSSAERSSSAVRNLRSLFENKGPESSPNSRGRSIINKTEDSRPTSKVRASFVSVDTNGGMATAAEDEVPMSLPGLRRNSSAAQRRGSFSEGSDGGHGADLKKTISDEMDRREKETSVSETIPEAAIESAVNTPMVPTNRLASEEDPFGATPVAQKENQEPMNPDKPVMAVEEDPAQMRPAEPTNADAVSGGEALPPAPEDLRPSKAVDSAAVPAQTQTPQPISGNEVAEVPARQAETEAVETPTQATQSPKRAEKPSPSKTTKSSATSVQQQAAKLAPPKSEAKPETRRASHSKAPVKKPSRSSLTAPTAASVARTAASDRITSTSSTANVKHSPTSKPKATKPSDLPSRLTAPTAAFKAKHESTPATAGAKPSTTSRARPASTRPTPRTSLAPGQRAESRTSTTSRKPAPPPEGSFLERMMRPTAASANKTHEKVEVKSPPRKSAGMPPAPKPKTNGHWKKPAAAVPRPTSRPDTEKSEGVPPVAGSESPVAATSAKTEPEMKDAPGNETPIPQTNGGHAADATLETTPAFNAAEIR